MIIDSKRSFCMASIMIIIILSGFNDVMMCDREICFTWKVVGKSLIFTCTVPKVLYRISIEDPKGDIKAHCIPSLTCHTFKNDDVMFPLLTSELVLNLSIHGNIEGYTLTGTWNCRHGLSRGKANTTVAFFGGKEITTTEYLTGVSLQEATSTGKAITIESLSTELLKEYSRDKTPLDWKDSIGSTFMPQQSSTTRGDDYSTENPIVQLFRTFLVPFVAVLIAVFLMFALCNIWISRKCSSSNAYPRSRQLDRVIPRAVVDNLHRAIKTSQSEYNYRDEYEYINEANLAVNKPRAEERTNIEVGQNETIIYPALSSSSSSSETSYLDVIDSNSRKHSYEKVASKVDVNNDYSYCRIFFHIPDEYSYDIFAHSTSIAPHLGTKYSISTARVSDITFVGGYKGDCKSELQSKSCPNLSYEFQHTEASVVENVSQHKHNVNKDILHSV